jgi:hypothetical protein
MNSSVEAVVVVVGEMVVVGVMADMADMMGRRDDMQSVIFLGPPVIEASRGAAPTASGRAG